MSIIYLFVRSNHSLVDWNIIVWRREYKNITLSHLREFIVQFVDRCDGIVAIKAMLTNYIGNIQQEPFYALWRCRPKLIIYRQVQNAWYGFPVQFPWIYVLYTKKFQVMNIPVTCINVFDIIAIHPENWQKRLSYIRLGLHCNKVPLSTKNYPDNSLLAVQTSSWYYYKL